MAKTLLQLLNEVGKNLRRSTGATYTSITQDQNAVSIVQSINEAKRMVEEAWDWPSLIATTTFDGAAGTHTYNTGSGGVATAGPTNDRSKILRDRSSGKLLMWDVTDSSEFRMIEYTDEGARHIEVIDDTTLGKPIHVAVYQNGDGLTFHFPWAPSGVRNYSARTYVPQDDLAAAATELTCPWRPVVLAATALELDDRGTDGARAERFWRQYDDALGKAISYNSTDEDFVLIPV